MVSQAQQLRGSRQQQVFQPVHSLLQALVVFGASIPDADRIVAALGLMRYCFYATHLPLGFQHGMQVSAATCLKDRGLCVLWLSLAYETFTVAWPFWPVVLLRQTLKPVRQVV